MTQGELATKDDLDSIIQESLNNLSEKIGIDLTPPTPRPPRTERELRDAIQTLKDYNTYVLYPLIEAQAMRMMTDRLYFIKTTEKL